MDALDGRHRWWFRPYRLGADAGTEFPLRLSRLASGRCVRSVARRAGRCMADERGRIVSGLEMLLAQAERQVEFHDGSAAPTTAMRRRCPQRT